VNQAECLACHQPLDGTSDTFTLQQLAAAKQGGHRSRGCHAAASRATLDGAPAPVAASGGERGSRSRSPQFPPIDRVRQPRIGP
jgi:hypothetical protein